jgi:hypothetical protein
VKRPSARKGVDYDVDLDPAPDRPMEADSVLMILGNLDRLEKFRQLASKGDPEAK